MGVLFLQCSGWNHHIIQSARSDQDKQGCKADEVQFGAMLHLHTPDFVIAPHGAHHMDAPVIRVQSEGPVRDVTGVQLVGNPPPATGPGPPPASDKRPRLL